MGGGWKLFGFGKSDDASIGNWHGNDTIWRMVNDLNKIILFSDKEGKICELQQRKMFVIGDMVVAGEGEGPLNPKPVKAKCIIWGENPLLFDMVASKLMNYSYDKLPMIKYNFLYNMKCNSVRIHSNNIAMDGKIVADLQCICDFKRPKGWEEFE